MMDLVGQQLGAYRLLHLLGRGGSASVYRGQHVFFNKEYAIKVWDLPGHTLKQDALAEARMIVSLKHPHIIPVHYFDVDALTKLSFLVMDYAPYGNLRQRHPEGMILPPSTVSNYVRQMADALTYAHQRQVIHCDIKPENMLISQQDDLLLSDFGIAVVKSFGGEPRDIQGTVEYMAPELFQRLPSPQSDQYALGIVAYEWLCGDVPFNASSLPALIQQHRHERPPSLMQRMPTLSPAIEKVIFKALEKEPSMRFASVQDFAQALEAACGVSPVASIATFAPATPGISGQGNVLQQPTLPVTSAQGNVLPQQPASSSTGRRTFIKAGVVGSLAAVIGGTGVVWWSTTLRGHTVVSTPTPAPTIGPIASNGLLTPGVLVWGADPGSGGAPYVFLDANSAPVGFEVDIANAIARKMGITQECSQTHYKWLEDDLQMRKIDIILNGWEITPGRLQNEEFSIPYYRYGQQLVVRANDERFSLYSASSQITLEEVRGYKFGTGADYKAADLLRSAGIMPAISETPISDLDHGHVDIIMVDTPIVAYYIQGKGPGALPYTALHPIGKPLFVDATSQYVIGFKKNEPHAEILRQEINQALLALKQDGTLKSIYQQWGLWNDMQKEIGLF